MIERRGAYHQYGAANAPVRLASLAEWRSSHGAGERQAQAMIQLLAVTAPIYLLIAILLHHQCVAMGAKVDADCVGWHPMTTDNEGQ